MAALAALWVYVLTLSPTVTWMNFGEDSGDLLSASATLGIPHPTGYSLYVLLGRVASLLPLGSIAFRINLISALAGAAGVYFLVRWVAEAAPRAAGPGGALFGALTAAGIYAFSRGAWSQSVLAEVYTLQIAILGAILWASARAARPEGTRALYVAAYLFGLGLSHHLLVLAAAPALGIAIWQRARAGALGAVPGALLFLLVIWGATPILYLPIRASLGPDFSWGVPNTPERLAWVLTGAQYAGNFFHRSAAELVRHLVPGRWVEHFGAALVLVGIGAVTSWMKVSGERAAGLVPAAAALLSTLLLLSAYSIADDVGYWMPVGYVACGLAGLGLAAFWGRSGHASIRAGAAGLAIVLVAWGLTRSFRQVDASKDVMPYLYAHRSLEAVEPNALIVSDYDGRTFSLWFYKATDFRESRRGVSVVYKSLLVWPWYLHHIAKRDPALAVPPGDRDLSLVMNRLVARNIRRRPVYMVRDDPALAEIFTTEPVGMPSLPIFRVRLKEPKP